MPKLTRPLLGILLAGAVLQTSTACWTKIKDDPAPPSAQADFYVDPIAPAPAYKTITAAAAAASSSVAPTRTIHVAAGTYSLDTGETFPIELRGISLVGAGTGVTNVEGLGLANAAPPSIATADDVRATFIVGDPTAAATIAHLSLTTGEPFLSAGSEGILCDRGNVSASGPSIANTTIDDVTFDGFDLGLRAAASRTGTATSGCSVLVRASTFENATFGVLADGSANSSKIVQLVALQVGDASPGGGNVFRNIHVVKTDRVDVQYNGSAVLIRSAVTGIVIENNRISDCDTGIWFWDDVGGDLANGAVIVGNDIGPLINAGVSLLANVVVARLESNNIHDVTTAPFSDINWSGVGVLLNNFSTEAFPIIRHARNNTIFANDVGVAFRTSKEAQVTAAERSDFGTADDPGGNTIRCNARGLRANEQQGEGWPGSDVETKFYYRSPATFMFEGNTWDHDAPAASPPLDLVSGIDLALGNGQVDAANAKTSATPPCPATLSPGPSAAAVSN